VGCVSPAKGSMFMFMYLITESHGCCDYVPRCFCTFFLFFVARKFEYNLKANLFFPLLPLWFKVTLPKRVRYLL